MMTHPKDRAERLKIKKIKFNEEKEVSSKVRRHIKEQIKDLETQDELAWARTSSSRSLLGAHQGGDERIPL